MTADFSNLVYRLVARGVAWALASPEMVRSVYVRRSVAAGEARFGRSDIDLGILIHRPASARTEGKGLLELAKRYRRLKAVVPVIGEGEIHDPESLRRRGRIDPYRASIDRRSALVLRGARLDVPEAPVPIRDCARRLIFWIETYLPAAVQRRNRRNLEKFALEMWGAAACATGLTPEPFVGRREASAALAGNSAGLPRDPLARCFHVASRMHRLVLPPVDRPHSPLIVQTVRIPPSWKPRILILLPGADHELPPQARCPGALVATPEALDLYLKYVNPFAYPHLPEDVLALGLHAPDLRDYAECCRRYTDRQMLRAPGFPFLKTAAVVARVAAATFGLESLRRGEIPGKLAAPESPISPSLSDYYGNVYPRLCEETEIVWRGLDELEVSSRRLADQ